MVEPDRSGASGAVLPSRQGLALIGLAAVAASAWSPLGTVVLIVAAALAVTAIVADRLRPRLLSIAAALAWGCLAALAFHLATDGFDVRYVWLYSSAELPLAYKIANAWGGDEGTTLMLAAFCLSLAARSAATTVAARAAALARAAARPTAHHMAPPPPIAGRVAALIAAWYAVTVAWLGPFAATPPDWLVDMPSQGMNAHLVKIWMLLHAPLVLIAYAWILLLVVPSVAALAGALPAWPAPARTQARRGWVVLSAGIGFGMIWAFEDPMYGQIWHWDPVQTAVFAVWCFLSAHLHALVSWRPRSAGWRWAPATAILAAVGAALAMAVTRNPVLASSHRYVGAQSWISHGALALVLLTVLAVFLYLSHRPGLRPPGDGKRTSASQWGLKLAQWGFAAAGVFALVYLGQAFVAAGLDLPRAAEDKPFMAMMLQLVQGEDRTALRAAFERWDVEGYALARVLLVPLALFGLVGGWYFLRRVSIRFAWIALAATMALAAAIWASGGVMSRHYTGRGMLSQRIVAVLPWLDAILIAGAFLALACVAWVVITIRRQGWSSLSAVLPSATVHVGVALMLWGGLLSTALNTQSEYQIPLADNDTWHQDRDGNAIRLPSFETGPAADGGFAGGQAVQALTAIEFRTPGGDLVQGLARYRDDRPPPERYDGPLRAACELIDYRYARHVSTPGYILEPAIDHAWTRALQVWVSPAAALAEVPLGAPPAEPPVATVLVKVFPFASLLWLGLILAVIGGAWLAFAPSRR